MGENGRAYEERWLTTWKAELRIKILQSLVCITKVRVSRAYKQCAAYCSNSAPLSRMSHRRHQAAARGAPQDLFARSCVVQDKEFCGLRSDRRAEYSGR